MAISSTPPQPGSGLELNADGVSFDVNAAPSNLDITGDLDFQNHKAINLGFPTADTDGDNKGSSDIMALACAIAL